MQVLIKCINGNVLLSLFKRIQNMRMIDGKPEYKNGLVCSFYRSPLSRYWLFKKLISDSWSCDLSVRHANVERLWEGSSFRKTFYFEGEPKTDWH